MSERAELEKLRRLAELERRAKNDPAPLEGPSGMVRFGRGMMDVYQGVKQRALGLVDDKAQADYTARVNDELRLYDQGRADGGQTGVDWWRIGGNIATPIIALPAGGTTTAARFGLGALAGGTAGLAMFNPRNTAGSTAMNTAIGAAGGGLINAAAPAIARGITAGGQAVKNKFLELARSGAQAVTPNTQIVNNIRVSLKTQGIDWDALPKAVQDSLVSDAKTYLTTDGALPVQAMARKADIEAIVGPGGATRAQVTRSPADWTLERNLQKTEANIPAVQRGEAPTLTGRYEAQDAAMKSFAQRLQDMAGGSVPAQARSTSAFQTGEKVMGAVKKAYDDLGDQVSEAYNIARQHLGAQADLPRANLDGRMQQALTDFEDVIPAPIKRRLEEIGITSAGPTNARRALTVEEGDKLLKLINKRYGSADPATKAALDEVRGALKDSVMELAQSGGQGAQRFQDAWSAASARFQKFEPKPLAAIVKDKADSARFFSNHILGGNPKDLQALVGVLKENGGEAAVSDVKQQVVGWLTNKATADGRGAFSGTNFDKALNQIGDDRMRVLFTPDELAQLGTLRRGSMAMTTEPPFAAPNRSNTSPSALGLLLRFASRVPGVNVVADPIERQIQASTQAKLLQGALSSAPSPTRATAQQAFRDEIARRAGLLNYGSASQAPQQATRGLLDR